LAASLNASGPLKPLFALLLLAPLGPLTAADSRLNVVVIMVDDMGVSDIGCYGSEIPTPNIDRLAAGGVRFTQFYNTARCSTTRASLMTGLYARPMPLRLVVLAATVGLNIIFW
jgi:arylsulfatase